MKDLKKSLHVKLLETEQTEIARNVEIPPCNTEGPSSFNELDIFSLVDPLAEIKA